MSSEATIQGQKRAALPLSAVFPNSSLNQAWDYFKLENKEELGFLKIQST